MGFKPAVETPRLLKPVPARLGDLRGRKVPAVQIGGFAKSAFGDGAAASARDVRIRVLNWCLGVFMIGR